jgi:hypothetical protein
MPIVVNLDVMLAKRKIRGKELKLALPNRIYPCCVPVKSKACGFRPWRIFAACWTASRGIFWNLVQMNNAPQYPKPQFNAAFNAWTIVI